VICVSRPKTTPADSTENSRRKTAASFSGDPHHDEPYRDAPPTEKLHSESVHFDELRSDEISAVDLHPADLHPDELWMGEALRCAQRALEAGEVPVGAVVVRDGKICGRGWNRNISDSDPTAHAEVVALREAAATVANHRLEGCELFATIEPCAMCAGALVHARIRRLVYGANDPKAGAVQSVMHILNHPQLNRKIEVRSGVLAGRSAELLQEFFKSRR
jgi:tRNA(adenine34) deaminase